MEIGQMVVLGKGPYPVVACEKCSAKMIDIAQADLGIGDLMRMKVHGLKMGDPATKRVWCIDCEVETPSVRRKIKQFFDDPTPSSDSHFWGSVYSGGGYSGGSSGGSSSGGFGGFGGFGGGGFSGGGASGGF